MLVVEGLTKDFSNLRAVDNLSFHLDAGRVCGFVGPNGAGKTTSMRIIATLEEPTEGQVFVDGRSIFESPYEIRRMMGFMPDHYGTYPDLNVRDYLEFFARAYEIEPAQRSRRIEQIMDFTGLGKISEKKVEELSKGMRQRLNLGRALINDPKILIMDEPAAGLDPRARIELRFLIKQLADQGKTIFISSHILTELAEICDHLLVIDKGRMITFGSFQEIQRAMQKNYEISARLITAEEAPRLERFLLEHRGVADVRVGENGTISFTFLDPPEQIPALIRAVMNQGFSLMEFRPEMLSMEDVFIQITQGELQ